MRNVDHEDEGPSLRRWWRENLRQAGLAPTCRRLVAGIGDFVRESTPGQRRQRYGDAGYDWDYRVDTTSATVGWRERLLGALYSPYQATEPELFAEMLSAIGIDFRGFTFIDVGSGKGRVLLMAADYPFLRILGVELLPALHRIARENIREYKSDRQQCCSIESICQDGRDFEFPAEPTVLYLFNPLPEAGLVRVLGNLERSLRDVPRRVHVIYHNPLLEHVLAGSPALRRTGGTHQYVVYSNAS